MKSITSNPFGTENTYNPKADGKVGVANVKNSRKWSGRNELCYYWCLLY